MAIVAQGQSQLVNLGPNDAIKVSTPGEAYVDHISGTPESPYASARLIKNTQPKVFGPYGVNAQLRVRAIELSALYDGYTDPQPALVNTDPTTDQTVITGPDGFRMTNALDSTSLGIIGDSNTAAYRGGTQTFNETYGYKATSHSSIGYIAHAMALSEQRLKLTADFSKPSARVQYVEGETVPSLERQMDGIILSGVRNLLILGGTNDIVQDYSTTSITDAFARIINRAEAAGIKIYLCTCLPINSAPRASAVLALNSWIKSQSSQLSKSLHVIDIYSKLIDPTSSTATIMAGAYYDQLHLGALGASVAGRAVADAIIRDFPAIQHFPQTRSENRGAYAGSNQLLPNPVFSYGSGGLGTGFAVQKSAGVGTVTTALVPDPDGVGQNQVLEWTTAPGDANGYVRIAANDVFSLATRGKRYYLMAEIVVETTAPVIRAIRGQLYSASSTPATVDAIGNTSPEQTAADPNPIPHPTPGKKYILRTPEMTIGETGAQLLANIGVITLAGVTADVKMTIKKAAIFEVAE